MAKRRRSTSTEFTVRELDLQEARRMFNRKRGRGSKYDAVIEAADKLDAGKALMIERISYSEVTGVRMRLRDHLDAEFKIEATKVDRDKNLYDLLISRKS